MDSITEISFSNAPFDMLTVPEEKKKVIKSLAESRVSTKHEDATVDDVIVGKGQGVIILLQYVPGVCLPQFDSNKHVTAAHRVSARRSLPRPSLNGSEGLCIRYVSTASFVTTN